jgi:hypothetical protein
MGKTGFRAGAGRPPKKVKTGPAETAISTLKTPDLGQKRYKTALEWCMDKINDPNAPDDLKYRIAAVTMPFQSPRVETLKRKKELQREAANQPAQTFAPSALPTQLRVA